MTLNKYAGAGTLRVIAVSPSAAPPFDEDDWELVPFGSNLAPDYFLSTGPYHNWNWYAEGVAPGDFVLELKFDDGNPMPVADRVRFTVVDIDVKEVSFEADAETYSVRKDDTSVFFYTAPHWLDVNLDGDAEDQGDHMYPVCYVRSLPPPDVDRYVQADVLLIVTPSEIFTDPVTVRAVGPDSYEFEEEATLNGSNLQLQDVQSTEALPDVIDFHDPMVLEWQVSPDGGTIRLGGAQSRNRTYVTRDVPNTGSRFYTLLHNSCRDADGLTDEAQVIAAIWSDFTDLEVYRVDPTGKTQGTKLTYYGSWSCQHYSTAHLLEHGDGQCGAWAKFFIDEMGAQGINHTNEYVLFYHVSTNFDYGFCVKNWQFTSSNGMSHSLSYPYLNLDGSPFIVNNAYQWVYKQVDNTPGIQGQGREPGGPDEPASLFGNHQVVKIDNNTVITYYDPSYGITYTNLSEIDGSAIDGYYYNPDPTVGWAVHEVDVQMDLNGDNDSLDIVIVPYVHLFAKNLAGNQLQEITDEYP